MISAYRYSINDDPLVRAYLAIAMGATRDIFYADDLIEGLNDDSRESRLAAIQAVGMVGTDAAVDQLVEIIKIVTTIISEVRLNIKLKLFLMKTPTIRIEKIDRDKKISGNIIFKLLIMLI